MDITYKVLPTFTEVHDDGNPYIFVMGPVGSGKSSGCIMHAFFNAMRQKPDSNGVRKYRHLVVRATYPALKSTVIKTWIEWFKDKITITYSMPIVGKINHNMPDGTRVEMEIFFIAVDSDQAAEKLRSLEVSSVHVNEASEIPEGVFQILKTRFNRYPAEKDGGVVNPFIIMDYNAVSTEHWLYRLSEEDKPEGMSFYKQPPAVIRFIDVSGKVTYRVNPEAENIDNLADNYYENQIIGTPEDFIQVNLMNNYGEVRKGKPVYKDYDDVIHSFDKEYVPIQGSTIVIGVDLGLTPAAVFTQQGVDGTVTVFDEIVTKDCSITEFIEDYLWPMIKVKYYRNSTNYYIVVDPAARQRSTLDARSPLQFMREKNLPVKIARTNNPLRRIDAVSTFLRRTGKFKITTNCNMLRKGFISGYRYRLTNALEDMYKDTPDKNEFSHVHDALQYAMLVYEPTIHRNANNAFGRLKSKFPTRSKYSVPSAIGGY